ncbi:MAG: hypothetical protein NC453_17010 [Muribaculum sp.]|nr:hypothetical protein [Muribaculum sp.]
MALTLDIFAKTYLGGFDPAEPLFWKLRLPYAQFMELEAIIDGSSADEIKGAPIAALAYLAEWYKWRYSPQKTNAARRFNPGGQEIRSLLESAGIDIGRWVAVNPETGRHSWLYSVFVLGGLPVAHELNRRADNRFLKNLCRMYHGENIGGGINDTDRAEAFRQSLNPGGSLYAFIRDITSGNLPFAKEDIDNKLSPASQLIQRIIDANNEVLRDKFRLEWLISAPYGAEYFGRRICLSLLPEISGEGLHQYLMYDRVRMWGFEDPANIRWLEFGLRFLLNDKEVEIIPPFLSYTNNYNPDRGFLSVGVDRAVIIRDVPVAPFDKIEIYVSADNGEQRVAQCFEIDSAMQLYATGIPGEWTSATLPQHPTAVLWKNPWHNIVPIAEGLSESRAFKSRTFGVGKTEYNLTLVPESLTLVNQTGEEVTFYDHQGIDILTARRHDDVVRYVQGDKIRYIHEDEEGMEEELLLPLLMTRNDVAIRHMDIDEFGETTEEIIQPELIEFKVESRYVEWTDEVFPTSDRIKVRCAVRGRQLIKEFAYTDGEIKRDLREENLKFRMENLKLPYWENSKFSILNSQFSLAPTIEVPIGKVRLDVWLPIDCKEINQGDRCYLRSRESTIAVPAIAASELWVAIFDNYGYRRYSCSPLISVYSRTSMVDKIGKLINGTIIKALTLDSTAPPQLDVVFAYPISDDEKENSKWLEWDYMPESSPGEAEYGAQLKHNTVLFQDCRDLSSPLYVYCPKRNVFAFKLKSVLEKTSLWECFKIASKYKTYFFLFTPLEKMSFEQFQKEVYEPLLAQYHGIIPPELKNELTRAAIELGFMTIQDEIQ